jgi:hypothetical protein
VPGREGELWGVSWNKTPTIHVLLLEWLVLHWLRA